MSLFYNAYTSNVDKLFLLSFINKKVLSLLKFIKIKYQSLIKVKYQIILKICKSKNKYKLIIIYKIL